MFARSSLLARVRSLELLAINRSFRLPYLNSASRDFSDSSCSSRIRFLDALKILVSGILLGQMPSQILHSIQASNFITFMASLEVLCQYNSWGSSCFGQTRSHSPHLIHGALINGAMSLSSSSITGVIRDWLRVATRSIQSTGQGGMHRSHPVHSFSITTCINWAAPIMASTGQA